MVAAAGDPIFTIGLLLSSLPGRGCGLNLAGLVPDFAEALDDGGNGGLVGIVRW